MQKEIILKNQKIIYQLKKNVQTRRLSLMVKENAQIIVTIPKKVDEKIVEKFIQQKAQWLLNKVAYFKNKKRTIPLPNKKDYLKYKDLAYQIAEKKINYFNSFYNFSFSKIAIHNPSTRWGSCSSQGNLNFSYRIIFLAEKLSDYVIVHELCHLKEFNHSTQFWNLVAKTIPDYREIKKKIRTM